MLLVHPVILLHKIAHIVALLIFGKHSFGDTLLPRVHTASQQAHGKLKIDSIRFYTHKFLQGMCLDLRKTRKKKRKLVGGTAQDVQTNIREEDLQSRLLCEYEYKSRRSGNGTTRTSSV